MGKEWTEQEINKLKEIYPNHTNKKVADILNRSYSSVCTKGSKLNLNKTKKHKQKIYSKCNSGKNSGNFKNYRIINSEGYVMLKKDNYPGSQKSGYIPEHKYKMEQKIGRILKENELVHHINGDKTDNRLENLQLLTRSEHITEHHLGAKRSEEAIKNMKEAQQKKVKNMSKSEYPNYKNINLEKMIKMRKQGKTIKKICEKLNICTRTYYNKLKEYKRRNKNA